jgi:hypothetical protein
MNHEELAALKRSLAETLERFGSALDGLNDTPSTAPVVQQGVGDAITPTPQATRRIMSRKELFDVRSALNTKSNAELMMLFSEQARHKDKGIPLDYWLSAGGQAVSDRFDGISGQLDPEYQRALDTGGSAALIRQDLEPVLYELFIRMFPAFERFRREPANGLVHTWNQITDYGDAQFMAELGTVQDDRSTYVRQTTNIAIISTRRGISLKARAAVPAGGMAWNPEQIELQGGLRSIAHRMQQQIFSGHATDSGGTSTNELGLYDANAFTGLRSILNTARAYNVDPATNPDTTGNIQFVVDAAVEEILQTGGAMPTILWSHPHEKRMLSEQQASKTRIVVPEQTNIAVGVTATSINTAAGNLPWAVVPGDSINTYEYAGATQGGVSSGDDVRDLYILDESTITLPYLGSEGPTVLDIPVGVSGQLVHLYIVFGMWGLAVKAPTFSNKVRVKVA